jgi:hypothetical protein
LSKAIFDFLKSQIHFEDVGHPRMIDRCSCIRPIGCCSGMVRRMIGRLDASVPWCRSMRTKVPFDTTAKNDTLKLGQTCQRHRQSSVRDICA